MGSELSIYVQAATPNAKGEYAGDWVTVDKWDDEESVLERIAEAVEGASEWIIDGNQGAEALNIKTIDQALALREGVEDWGEAYVLWVEDNNMQLTDVDDFREAYRGTYRDEREFAEECLIDEFGSNTIGALDHIIDWDKAEEHAAEDFTILQGARQIHVFD